MRGRWQRHCSSLSFRSFPWPFPFFPIPFCRRTSSCTEALSRMYADAAAAHRDSGVDQGVSADTARHRLQRRIRQMRHKLGQKAAGVSRRLLVRNEQKLHLRVTQRHVLHLQNVPYLQRHSRELVGVARPPSHLPWPLENARQQPQRLRRPHLPCPSRIPDVCRLLPAITSQGGTMRESLASCASKTPCGSEGV